MQTGGTLGLPSMDVANQKVEQIRAGSAVLIDQVLYNLETAYIAFSALNW